jgi:hypothetical protein
LLLPYFEVDLADLDGVTTMFSIGNAVDDATLVNVTLWTDLGVPTMAFPVYLTGWDIETVNIRDLFTGRLPRTASDGQDPSDSISPQGQFSQDIHFASCTGQLPLATPAPAFLDHLRAAHTGKSSALLGGCSGRDLADGKARGYITIDVVKECSISVSFPSDVGYFGPNGRALSANVLFGDVFYVDSAQNAARGQTLVAIEAYPGRFRPNEATFYGRFKYGGQYNYQAVDDREPLASTWSTRYLTGGVFSGGSSFVVWQDPGQDSKVVPCGTRQPWFLTEQLIAFDEEENVEEPAPPCPFLCPPIPPPSRFPAVSQRVGINDLRADGGFSGPLGISFDFGWFAVQFGPQMAGFPRGQAWMGSELEASGRFSLGLMATPLDSTCGPHVPLPGGF